MLFRNKNKIKKSINQIDNNTVSDEITSEFELLSNFKRKNKEKEILRSIFINPFVLAKKNINEKAQWTKNYFKNNYIKLVEFGLLLLFFAFAILGFWIMFSPYPINICGNVQIPISNFYLAQDGAINGITGVAISFIVVFGVLLISFLLYIFLYKKTNIFLKETKALFIISIINWLLLLISIIFMLVIVFYPPEVISAGNQQEIYNLIFKIKQLILNNDTVQAEALIKHLSELSQDPSYNIEPLLNPTIQGFNDWVHNSSYFINISNTLTSLIYTSEIGSYTYVLTTSGKLIIGFMSTLFILSIIVFPIILFIVYSLHELNINNEEIIMKWGSFRIFFFSTINKIKTMFSNIKNKHKSKDSFYKYKKRSKNKGILTKENQDSFTTDTSKTNIIKQTITKEEIEINPPNIAFLSKESKWMYHDGHGNYYIAKDNQWVPYDLEQEINKVQANVIDESLDFSPSNKTAKENKINLFNSRKESSIALPDEEIDNIVKDLNI